MLTIPDHYQTLQNCNQPTHVVTVQFLEQSWMKWIYRVNDLDCQHLPPLGWRIDGSICSFCILLLHLHHHLSHLPHRHVHHRYPHHWVVDGILHFTALRQPPILSAAAFFSPLIPLNTYHSLFLFLITCDMKVNIYPRLFVFLFLFTHDMSKYLSLVITITRLRRM